MIATMEVTTKQAQTFNRKRQQEREKGFLSLKLF